jgi:hypothetical protein
LRNQKRFKQRETAGELQKKVLADTTKYNAIEVGHALSDDIGKHLDECIRNHIDIIDEPEFCVVMVIATDPLIKTLQRRKFYAWPYLPSPRPNQAVFLFNKAAGKIIKRLWVLPSAMVMAELTESIVVHQKYKTMQAWSMAFMKGTFWEYIRYEHDITMLSEREYFLLHREELIKAGCQIPDSSVTNAFDFDKIMIEKVVDTQEAVISE